MVENNGQIDREGLIATEAHVEYRSDAGRFIFIFENPDERIEISLGPYSIRSFLDELFEEGKWGAVPDLDAMIGDGVFSTPEGLQGDDEQNLEDR